MTEQAARDIARHTNGEAFHTGGNRWVVRYTRNDGSLAILDDNGMLEYENVTAWEEGTESAVILFAFAN